MNVDIKICGTKRTADLLKDALRAYWAQAKERDKAEIDCIIGIIDRAIEEAENDRQRKG